MNFKTIDIEQLLMLHSLVLAKTGGGDGARDVGRLESAVATQTQEVFGSELYSTIFEKAAAVGRGIVADHPFVDGNKRTAMLAALTILGVNDYELIATNKQLEDFAVQAAVDHLEVADITTWLKAHSQPKMA